MYYVIITETRLKIDMVEAKTEQEAAEIIERRWKKGQINLSVFNIRTAKFVAGEVLSRE